MKKKIRDIEGIELYKCIGANQEQEIEASLYFGKMLEASARGYCTERNKKKVLDPELLEDITKAIVESSDEIIKLRRC